MHSFFMPGSCQYKSPLLCCVYAFMVLEAKLTMHSELAALNLYNSIYVSPCQRKLFIEGTLLCYLLMISCILNEILTCNQMVWLRTTHTFTLLHTLYTRGTWCKQCQSLQRVTFMICIIQFIIPQKT